MLERHGFSGVFGLIIGSDAEIGETMINDKRLPLISATGSTRMGRHVNQAVAARLGRCLLELGGNIGACTIEMLMRTSASLLVFEPNPQNLFHLTSTLRTLELERPQLGVADRVVVFPIGIGNESFESRLHVAHRNHGDSIVGTAVHVPSISPAGVKSSSASTDGA